MGDTLGDAYDWTKDKAGGAYDWTKDKLGAGYDAVKEIPIVGDVLGAAENALSTPDTSGLDQAAADSRALTQMFLAQQGKLAAVPGLVGPGYDAPVATSPVPAPVARTPVTAALPDATPAIPGVAPLSPAALASIPPGKTTLNEGTIPGATTPLTPAQIAASRRPGGASTLTPENITAVGGSPLTDAQIAAVRAPGSITGGPPPAAAPPPGGAPGGGAGAAPGAPGLDPRQQEQFRQGQLALASSIGQALGADKPDASRLDETRSLETRGQQQDLASTLRNTLTSAPSATPTLDQARQLEARGRQLGAIGSLEDAVAGRVPSVAEMQGNRQIGNLQSNIMGNATAQARGGNTALALRSALAATGRLGGDAVANAAMARAQEQATSRGQLVSAVESLRGQDVNVAGQDLSAAMTGRGQNIQQQATSAAQLAGLLGDTRTADLSAAGQNLQSEITNRGQNIQETTAARGQLADVLASGRGTDVDIASKNQGSQITTRGQNIDQEQNQARNVIDANRNQSIAAGAQFEGDISSKKADADLLTGAAGAITTATGGGKPSDRRLKEDIKRVGSGVFREFLSAADPSRYRYKGKPDPEFGTMAQDLERSEVGDTIVRDTPEGKVIDIPSATGALIAALADVHRRVNRLEGRG